jgi:putative transposase
MSTFTNLRVHFIWSTKNREPLIREDFQADLYAYIGGILRERKHVLLSAGGIADHIHLLVGMHPQQSISDLVRDVKSNSSIWIHENQTGLGGFAWQSGYGAFSVSQSAVSQVSHYIDNQKEHHGATSFKSEFIKFLERHGIEYDEKYVWE